MTWKPMSEEELWDLINSSYERMSVSQRKLWETLKIDPIKWELKPWGNQGNGFWVVALFGDNVIWYNDIEDGFNISKYKTYGIISDYWCNQDELEHSIQSVINQIKDGYDSSGKCGPPKPISA